MQQRVICGFLVSIERFNSAKWGAEWIGKDKQKVRIFRKTETALLQAIPKTMILRKDIQAE